MTHEPFTNADLDDIYRKLCEGAGQPRYDENGKPVYTLAFYGTEEEFEVMKRRLQEVRTPTTPFTYVEIPQSVLDKGYRCPVHVKGWRTAFRFTYLGTDPDGTHRICSSKGTYRTKNPLLYTQRNTPRK